MLGIYLAACKARHPNHNIIYQDIDSKYNCDITGDMLYIDLKEYDYVIATPPCNWWSKANPYYYRSPYAWRTINLLPLTIMKCVEECCTFGKPFIIENVINRKRFEFLGIYRLAAFFNLKVFEYGRHTYITNVYSFNPIGIPQIQDFRYGGIRINNDGYNQGGTNVFNVIEAWINYIEGGNYVS